MLEMLVAMNISDFESYQKYREEMIPILHSLGGSFGYDFLIEETLKSETDHKINRVFTIKFPSKDIMDEFFSREDYKSIKVKYFENSVLNTTIISEYTKS